MVSFRFPLNSFDKKICAIRTGAILSETGFKNKFCGSDSFIAVKPAVIIRFSCRFRNVVGFDLSSSSLLLSDFFLLSFSLTIFS